MLEHVEPIFLSRLQFAITAMYHFIFVPLTLGLSVLIAIMETIFVMTGREIYRQMTKFWGSLFGINFAMGVATGITMEFQFGTNWAYYSQYVGDVFGAPLAIEGLMAFFLEATFIGLFFFGWNKLSRVAHCMVTWMVALGSSLSALWILVANAWMQNPVGAKINYETMRMEITSFSEMFFNPVAQAKFVHTISAGYVTGSMFVLAISAYYLLRNRHYDLAKRSIAVAASFGLLTALSVVVLGDESGYAATHHQQMKIAAMEGMWETQQAPASFTAFGIPDQETHQTKYKVEIPFMLGLLTTRSYNTELPGIKQLVAEVKPKIRQGIEAFSALQVLHKDPYNQTARQTFERTYHNLGYGLLLKRFVDDPVKADDAAIEQAAWYTVPYVGPLFWSFRIMVLCGFYFIFLFATAFYLVSKRDVRQKWFLRMALYSLPLPWIAAELGWFVAEHGRQPWVIEGILPTFLGVSNLTMGQVLTSFIGFILFYSLLAVVEVFLMVKYIRLGPEPTMIKGAQHV